MDVVRARRQVRLIAEEDLSLSLLRREASGRVVVGGGPWAGSPWPADLLEPCTGRIGDLECPIVDPRAQVEIERMTPVRVPGSPRRAKDAEDIARLQEALRSGRRRDRRGRIRPP